jgi:hypothetical protein
MTIKQLKELDMERLKVAHPLMWQNHPHAVVPYDYKQNSANSLTRCIVDAINFTGDFAVRINNGGTFRKGQTIHGANGVIKMKDTYSFNGTKGVADIDAMKSKIVDGKKQAIPVKIEVKFGKDKMSPHQHVMKERIERAGGVYLIAHNLEQFWTEWEKI